LKITFFPESLNLAIEEYSTSFSQRSFGWDYAWWVGFNVGFVGVVSIGISALPRRYYESRCTHLRERVAPAVARLLRRT
jgi:hypothetical protein